jgi:cytochrome c oxidase accessory protein FixG
MSDSLKKIPVKVVNSKQDETIEISLFEEAKKIYPRSTSGLFAYWRIALVIITQLVFYGGPWLQWNGRQAILFDVLNRKFYIFGLVLWPQDFVLLAALLMLCAFGLFWWTAIAGRLWCGYACPQTVYTEIFLWIEEWIEGDRPKRMKLDEAPFSLNKLRIKASKHAAWILLSFWTGFTFVGFFTPIHLLWSEMLAFRMGPWESFWVVFYGFATYGNAGFMREQVCKYMCPYARFQSAMFDHDTLIISYDAERGDPRGSRRKNADYKKQGLGDCVNCGICVQVCPTGIDIRDGLQYECIGCAACIDACDQVMEKMDYPKGLIRYTTENALNHTYQESDFLKRLFRPRIVIYTVILILTAAAMVVTLAMRSPVRLDIIRDRSVLVKETSDGWLENLYQVQVINTDEKPRQFKLSVSGLPGIKLTPNDIITVPAAATHELNISVQVEPQNAPSGSSKIEFEIKALDRDDVKLEAKSSFIGLSRR